MSTITCSADNVCHRETQILQDTSDQKILLNPVFPQQLLMLTCLPLSLLIVPWQLGGACLLGVGIWVIVDPTGFREIVAANPLLFTGAYIMLAMGAMLFLLGFLGCCGAIRENKCLLLFVSVLAPSAGLLVFSRNGGDFFIEQMINAWMDVHYCSRYCLRY